MDCGNQEYGVLQNSKEKENQLTLSSLNEYCLLKVFNYLYINDSINLGQTCKQLRKVSNMAASKFKQFSYDEYMRYTSTAQQHFSVGKILNYISPHIESLDLADCNRIMHIRVPGENEYKLHIALTKVKFPKLRSLAVENSSDLKWINASSVNKLDIRQLNRSDLNNFTFGLINLKQIILGDIASDVSTEELLYFLEKNSNIECIEFFCTIPHQLRNGNFPKLKKLKHLEFIIEKSIPNLMYLLQIEELTVLKIEFRHTFLGDHRVKATLIDEFLKKLAQKKTLKSLELISMNFENDSLFDTLSLLNLVSLRILCPVYCADFSFKLAKTSFPTLTDLEIFNKINIHETLFLINHLKTLERLTVCHLKKYNSQTFLEQLSEVLSQSLKETTVTRPILELKNMMERDTVKIYFDLGHYEIVKNVTYRQYRNMFEPKSSMIGDSSSTLQVYKLV